MYGAILGDIIGSPYEFDRGSKTKDFPLFCTASTFTDDTVMTIAVAEAFLESTPEDSDDAIRQRVTRKLQFWGRRYPDAGYGARFIRWLHEKNPKPYGSWGNGSAMRVSAWMPGWVCPRSHLHTATAETPSSSAKACWDMRCFSR